VEALPMTRLAASIQSSLEPAAAPSHAAAGALHEPLLWPAWGIALLGGLCVLIGLGYCVVRLSRVFTRGALTRSALTRDVFTRRARTRRDG
jgi:hypothetical protein